MSAAGRAGSQRVRPYHWPQLDDTAELAQKTRGAVGEFVPVSLHPVVAADEARQRPPDEAPADGDGRAGGERLLAMARQEADQIRAEVQRQAAAEAREKLEFAVRAAIQEQTAAFEQARGQLLEDLRGAYEQRLAEIEQEMVSVITAMAEKVVRRKLEADDEIVLEVVRETLGQAAGANQVTVRISPADEPLVREAQQQLLAALGPVDDLQIVADDQVARGGCLVETERGRFDARVDTQLRLLSDEVDRLLKAG